jgi:lipopolysaccharide export system permease protein
MRVAGLTALGRLDRYVARLFLGAYATAFLLVVGLYLILQVASQLDFFEPWANPSAGGGPPRATTSELTRYYLLSIPYYYLQVGPFVTLVAGLFTVAKLVRHNELVAALSAGVSARRLLTPVLAGACAAALVLFFVREFATIWIAPQRDALYDVLDNHRRERVDEYVWVRDDAGSTVRIERYKTGVMEGVRAFLKQGGVRRIMSAKRAEWQAGRWLLEDGASWTEGRASEVTPIGNLDGIDVTPQDVRTAIRASEQNLELAYAEVLKLARRDPDNLQMQTLLQYLITFPVANLVLLLVGLPFMLGRDRGRLFEGLITGGLLCVLYFCLDSLTREWGMNGDLSPLVASWSPLVLFGSLGIVLWEGMRT